VTDGKKLVLTFYNLSVFLIIRKFLGMYKENTNHNCNLPLLHLESMVSKIKLKKLLWLLGPVI